MGKTTKRDFLTRKERKVVNEFSSQLKSVFGKDLIQIKLIGSKVKGNFTRDSEYIYIPNLNIMKIENYIKPS